MKPPKNRFRLPDGSIVDWSVAVIKPDKWRPHGVKYSLEWIQNEAQKI